MEDHLNLNMETEDLISLPASGNPGDGPKNNGPDSSNFEVSADDCLPSNSEIKEAELNGELCKKNEADVEREDSRHTLVTNNDPDLVDSTTIMEVSVELNETVLVKEGANNIGATVYVENGLAVKDGSPFSNHKRDGSTIRSPDIDALSAVKRPRITVDELQASVHVNYNSLTRESKRKLEELLQKWSEWHSRHCSSSNESKNEVESGERTYFPALHVGVDKPSAVSFWIDNDTRNLQSKELPLDNNSVPLYDRGYSFSLASTDGSSNPDRGLEIVDASRCFNCGSYNHSLKECPKPRDNAAVNSARKQQKTRRNQNAISRNPTRYYQDTPGGKFDGLRPGVLDTETRRLLGLGELDPPPWLNRMREIGYPPGYLDPEVENLPSGITIFGDEEKISAQETEDGEILDTDRPEPLQSEAPRKMSVEFPGINAPVPENADERRWADGPSSFDPWRNRSQRRLNHSTEPISKPHSHEQRWTRDFREDGPPGVDPGNSPLSRFSPRYGDYDSRSPSYGRYMPDRGRRSPLVQETSYHDYHRSENQESDRWGGFNPDSSSHRKDKHDEHLRHGRR